MPRGRGTGLRGWFIGDGVPCDMVRELRGCSGDVKENQAKIATVFLLFSSMSRVLFFQCLFFKHLYFKPKFYWQR